MLVSSGAVFVSRHSVLFGLGVPAVLVVMRRLPVVMCGRFVVCCGLMVVVYRWMFCSGHGPVPLISGGFPVDWTRTWNSLGARRRKQTTAFDLREEFRRSIMPLPIESSLKSRCIDRL